jgi:hypothetical protein
MPRTTERASISPAADVPGTFQWRVALFWTAFAALVLIRVPSIVQPAGGDQGLYWYVGQRIAHGELPYRDAWDQKPPGIHVAYALMTTVWPRESAVPGADLLITTIVAVLLVGLGRASGVAGAGEAAALLFLALGNPIAERLGGVRVRAQCETFIALAVTAAMFLVLKRDSRPAARRSTVRAFLLAGVAIGVAAVFKYNAVAYAVVPLFIWLIHSDRRPSPIAALGTGIAAPGAALAACFAARGAWRDLVDATVAYNLQYSGETYSGPASFAAYLLSFPVQMARVDSLWLVGCAGCAVLLAAGTKSRALLLAPVWVAIACLAIAINGSRGLPQYFVQAAPGLALAAGTAAALIGPRLPAAGRTIAIVLVAIGVWRVADVPKGLDYTLHDWRRLTGALSRDDYLARFGTEASGEKFSAAGIEHLAAYLRSHTDPDDRVLVFGFSGAAYAKAERASASRFFWSRPVIVEFNRGRPGYGPEGLLAELERTRPSCVVLQRRDWDPDTVDSATYFHRNAMLEGWLRAHYRPADPIGNYEIWLHTNSPETTSR